MTERQSTFEDVRKESYTLSLSTRKKRIIALLEVDCTQSMVAQKLNISRSSVNKTVKELEEYNLIKKKLKGNYNSIYDLAPELKRVISKEPQQKLTSIRVHYIRRKYKIFNRSAPASIDKRSGYTKQWMMRNGLWFKYWFPGMAGKPSVTIDLNPGSIIAYPDKGQFVIAESKQQAEDIINITLHETVQKFIHQQKAFGVTIEAESIGTQITKTHYAGAGETDHPAVQEIAAGKVPGWFADKSLDELGIKGITEVETIVRRNATIFERAMNLPDALPEMIRSAMPEAMKEFEHTFAPLTSEIHTVMAYIQSGQSVQNQINQLVVLVAQLVKDNHDLKKTLEGKSI